MGVTTGQLLCACVGSRDRAEYTVYGDAINLSARLMMKAAGGLGSVLCDKPTFTLAPNAASFFKLDPVRVSSRLVWGLQASGLGSWPVWRGFQGCPGVSASAGGW